MPPLAPVLDQALVKRDEAVERQSLETSHQRLGQHKAEALQILLHRREDLARKRAGAFLDVKPAAATQIDGIHRAE
jgi:hypothetical protein